ncbi:MAG TPA: phage tail protein, partial [Solirubrobacteraceae bacterium]|nr:phage tail protein [Solirubrobacteraceae bacterium]
MASGNGTAQAAELQLNAARYFRVEILEHTVGVFTRCSGLAVEYEVLEYAEGGENGFVHKLRGRMRYPNLLLSRGVTSEHELLDWLFASQQPSQRPTVTISLLDERVQVQRSWVFGQALPVRWEGPTLADVGEVAGETLEIAHAGLL